MNELSAAARALSVILAIVSAFVSVPLTAPLLLIFGGFAAIKNNSEKNSRNFLITIVLLLPTAQVLYVGLIWGFLLIISISYLISRGNHDDPVKEISLHVLVAVVVVVLSRFLGHKIAVYFRTP